jgi:hypothetical protein
VSEPTVKQRRRDLPRFAPDEYASLVGELLHNGYTSRPVEDIAKPHDGRALYLRHDIDIHITGIDRIGRIEAELGAVATYYVPLTLPFNPSYPDNAAVLRDLVAMGHRIGLHYDLESYPDTESAARARLDREAAALAEITGVMPRTICMHLPSLRDGDRFVGVDGYVHPHDPRYADGLLYVSDSCRAWRDEQLLRCFGEDPPRRLLLNTHPELWLGKADEERESFLEGTMLDNALAQTRAFVLETVRSWFDGHPGPVAERERNRVPRA